MADRRLLLKYSSGVLSALTAGCLGWIGDGSDTDEETTETPEPSDSATDEETAETTEPSDLATDEENTETPETPDAATIAFIGDQGLKETSRQVLRMIRNEGADLVIHAGDFDYENDPAAWNEMLTDELGPEFPYIATIGGHDMPAWDRYREVIRERASAADIEYTGDLGLQATVTYEDVTIVLSPVGFCQDEEEATEFPDLCEQIREYDQEQYIADQFASSDRTWRVCAWHKPNDHLNPGDKGTDAPVSAYDTCREHGALIQTADEHAYGRTYPMDSFADRSIASQSPPYTLDEGATFNVLSGVAGQSFYDPSENQNDPWWAATNTGADEGSFGAFFATFRPDGTGTCYFKDIDGRVLDGPFGIESGF